MPVPSHSLIARRFGAATFALLLASVQTARGHDPESREGKPGPSGKSRAGAIVGRVVEARTGTFLANVSVSLFRQSGAGLLRGGPVATRSQLDGSFKFEGIACGVYAIVAESPGYLKAGARSGPLVVTVLPAERQRSLVVELHPEGTIQGRLLNGVGQPVEGAKVRAFDRLGGTLREIASGGTDESGEFIVRQLPAGRYILLAELPALPVARTYFPSSPTVSGAVPIRVVQGDRVTGIRINLLHDPVHWIRGRIDDFRGVLGDQAAAVYVVPRSDSGMDLTALAWKTSLKPDRSFELGGVPSGLYRMQLVRHQPTPRVLAMQDVAVGSVDVEDLGLYPESSVSLSGRARVAGNSNRDLSAVRVVLLGLPNAAGFASSIDALVGRDGRFLVAGLEPTSYALQVQAPPDLYVERVSFGGHPVTGKVLDLFREIQGRLDIGLRAGAARIEGAVLETGPPPERASVAILCPAGEDPEGSSRRVVSAGGNRFAFGAVPPGTYRIFATDRFDPDLFGDPVFLAQVSGAVRTVRLRRYDRRQLDLCLINARQVKAAARRAGLSEI